MLQSLRNVFLFLVGHSVAWVLIISAQFLVPKVHAFVPHFTGRYSLGVATFIASVVPAVALGAINPFLFAGKHRAIWCWALSLSLLGWAFVAWPPIFPDDSLQSKVLLTLAFYGPFPIMGLVATAVLRWSTKQHAYSAA
jgi:hypothetical protein